MSSFGATRAECIAEFVGTFLLVLTVGCNVICETAPWHGVSIASVLMVSVYSFGYISSANFNPAVSFALALPQVLGGTAFAWSKMGVYMGVQVIAGLAAALTYSLLFWDSAKLITPPDSLAIQHACLYEMLYTFMLCFVVLNTTFAKRCAKANEYYGLAIGYVIVAGAYGAGAISGGAFNPAVAISVQGTSGLKASTSVAVVLCYVLAEFAGAVLAACIFRIVRPGDFTTSSVSDFRNQVAALTSEFIGTYLLMLTVGLSVLAGSPAAGFAIAASLMCMVYSLGDVSGAHFNPAVTLTCWMSGFTDLTVTSASLYVLVQIAAALCATATFHMYYSHGIVLDSLSGWSEIIIAETIFTLILCFVVLCTAVCPQTKQKNMFGLAIGSCVTIGGYAVGAVSGGCLNPAVSIALVTSELLGSGKFQIGRLCLYLLSQIIGAVTAVQIVRVTHATEDMSDNVSSKLPA